MGAVESALEHGLAHQKSQIVSALQTGVMRFAQSRAGAYILEKAFMYCNSEDQEALAADILAAPSSEMEGLTRSSLGCMVIRAMLRLSPLVAQQVWQRLKAPALLAQ